MWWTAFRATIRGGIHSTSSITGTTAAARSNLFYRLGKSQDEPGQKMKRKTASERQRNLERLFGTPHRLSKLKKSGFFSTIYWAFGDFTSGCASMMIT
uniref:Uncharacterized protein n=1 Tax=Ditylenchus dipsaci TaxID=166011 RepID=A0A915DZI2_9BILA